MAKIILTYPAEGVFNNADHLETYLDAGDASDRVDWLIDNENIDPLIQVECHDGNEYKLMDVEVAWDDDVFEAIAGGNNSLKSFGTTTREALIDLLDSANEIEKEYALSIANHKRWYNDRRKSYYIIVGVVRSCEAATWELLYKREEDAAGNEYFRRPAWEWQQLNRDGNPRFVEA